MFNSMIASVCRDFIGAAGVVLLLFAGIVLGQSSEATDYVTCAADINGLCSDDTDGKECAVNKICRQSTRACTCLE